MQVESTSVPCLVKVADSGVYYARVKVQGKIKWRSLETTTFTTAKFRLPDKLEELRACVPASIDSQIDPKSTFRAAMDAYKAAVNANPRLKPRSKAFRLRSEFTLRRTWPALFDMELRRITPEACSKFLQKFENGASVYLTPLAKEKTRAGNSPTTVNALISFLHHVFEIGVRSGICSHNAAKSLHRKRPSKKLLRLPNKVQFAVLVSHVRGTPGWGEKAADLIEGLTYTGMRVGESRRITWGHLDFERGLVTVPGEKTDDAPRTIPMMQDLRNLFGRMRGNRETIHTELVFKAGDATGSLRSGCKAAGIPNLTHHDLRHLFATSCIEAGVDIPTVADWLGHKDGGALAMRTYRHFRPEHSVEAAKKVSFRSTVQTN